MNQLDDDPRALFAAAASAQVDTGEAGRTYNFLGQPLRRLTYTHQLAYSRLTLDRMIQIEADIILIFLLLTKEAREADAIRGPINESAFRVAANEWAEKVDALGKNRAAVLGVAKEIQDDIEKARAVEPDSKSSGNA